MGCLKILATLIVLAMPAPHPAEFPHAGTSAALSRPTSAQAKPAKPVQVAYLDCGFDVRNVYRCRP